MVVERDPIVSDRYGTFYETDDGRAELSAVIDEERWRVQRGHAWIGRTRLVLSIAIALIFAGLIGLTQYSTPIVAPNAMPSPALSPATVETSTSDTVDVQTVYVYRSSEGEIETEFGSTSTNSDRPADAWATFNDSLHSIGWSQLWVRTANLTKEEYNDKEKARTRRKEIMYAAGYAEGVLTHHRIDEHFTNVYLTFFPNGDEIDKKTVRLLHDFFEKNLDWMYKQIRHHQEYPDLVDAEYWGSMSSVLAQFEGLVAGYHHATQSDSPASRLDLFMLNADGDLQDLVNVVGREKRDVGDDEGDNFSIKAAATDFYIFVKNLKCSALIRILPNFSDLVWGHATWDTFASMNRIFKHYDVPLPGGADHSSAVKRRISMSSSPGFLSSVDDWYMTSAGLGVMETTHGVFDTALYDFVTPHSVPCWLRSKIANFLGTDGPSWAETFAKYNSGTYNNQWMIVDSKKFVRGSGFDDNGLTVLEQLPGYVHVEDVSSVINSQGYWGSYNVPYYPEIYRRSGFEEIYITSNQTASWSHEECVRSRIFKRDAPNITSEEDLKRVMRSNNWRSDPLSGGHASHAVAARYDLETDASLFSLDGAIDAKVTTLDRLERLECSAAAGPTHDENPVFEWTPPLSALASHEGHPPRFGFGFEPMRHFA